MGQLSENIVDQDVWHRILTNSPPTHQSGVLRGLTKRRYVVTSYSLTLTSEQTRLSQSHTQSHSLYIQRMRHCSMNRTELLTNWRVSQKTAVSVSCSSRCLVFRLCQASLALPLILDVTSVTVNHLLWT